MVREESCSDMAKSVANLGDVAAAAGVSKSTVSRVLNNKLGNGFAVSSEVRQRILEIALQLRYRPNLMARGLTNQRTRMVSVLGGAHALSDMGNIYQTVINSITNVLDNAPGGFDVTVDMSQHAPEQANCRRGKSTALLFWPNAPAKLLRKSNTVMHHM